MKKLVFTTLALAALGAFRGDARAEGDARVSLAIDAVDFKGQKGQAIIAVYDAKDAWLKLEKAVQVKKVKLGGARLHAQFDGLAPGVYAVSVIHDENENGKLDMQWFPIPRPAEGAGVSNDASATVGPPSFADARFRLGDKGGALTIHMRY